MSSARSRSRFPSFATFRGSGLRVLESIVPALQIVIAATAAYSITHFGLGHPVPVMAMTVTISSLGFVRDARPVRVFENSVGIVFGIALAELLLLIIGHGVWQVAVILFVTLLVARLLSASNAFAIAAGVQTILVMFLPVPSSGPFGKSLDALIGGAIALLVTALIPRDARGIARRDAARLFAAFTASLASLSTALEHADEPSAEAALERLRSTQPVIDGWNTSLESAIAIARISPFIRHQRPELEAQRRVLRGMDFATRNLRVITRRVDFLVRDGIPRPGIAGLIAPLETSVRLLGQSIDDPLLSDTVRVGLVAIAERLRPGSIAHAVDVGSATDGVPVTDAAVILMLRPLLVDLLTAADMPEAKARAILPEI